MPLIATVALSMLMTSGHGKNDAPEKTVPDACVAEGASTEAVFRIPFRVVDGRIYVDARVNGAGPFAFAIDTGASGLGRADASLVKSLSLPITNRGESSDGVNRASVDMTHFHSLQIGTFRRDDFEVITRDYSSRLSAEAAISGIIGRDFFADGTLVIDYPARMLSFYRTLRLDTNSPHVTPYERPFRVKVRIGGVATEGNLDTGANVEFMMPTTLFDKISSAPLEVAGDATLTNTSLTTKSAKVAGPFRFGGATHSNIDVRVSDRFPELLIGARILQNYKLLIDQPSKLVAICPSG